MPSRFSEKIFPIPSTDVQVGTIQENRRFDENRQEKIFPKPAGLDLYGMMAAGGGSRLSLLSFLCFLEKSIQSFAKATENEGGVWWLKNGFEKRPGYQQMVYK